MQQPFIKKWKLNKKNFAYIKVDFNVYMQSTNHCERTKIEAYL